VNAINHSCCIKGVSKAFSFVVGLIGDISTGITIKRLVTLSRTDKWSAVTLRDGVGVGGC